MDKNACTNFLNTLYPLEEDALTSFQEKLHFEFYHKNEIILREGDICTKLWFIDQGLVRGYYVENHLEVTAWFAQEDSFFYAAESFLNRTASQETIQAVEKTQLMYVDRKDLYELYSSYPSINHAARIMAEKYRIVNQDRIKDLRNRKARERLISFAQKHRCLFLRVPQKYIASSIGLSEGYVSDLLGKIRV